MNRSAYDRFSGDDSQLIKDEDDSRSPSEATSEDLTEAIRMVRKCATCLYLAVTPDIADDVSKHIEQLISLIPAAPSSPPSGQPTDEQLEKAIERFRFHVERTVASKLEVHLVRRQLANDAADAIRLLFSQRGAQRPGVTPRFTERDVELVRVFGNRWDMNSDEYARIESLASRLSESLGDTKKEDAR